jgi:hypothetical protein
MEIQSLYTLGFDEEVGGAKDVGSSGHADLAAA